MAFCIKCGAELAQDAKFCVKCGNPVGVQSAAPMMESPVAPVMENSVESAVETPAVEESVVEFTPVQVPEVQAPEVQIPEVEVPAAFVPQAEVAVTEEPIMEQPVAEQPVMGEPVMQQPVMEQPVMQPPVMGEPVMQQPVMGQPAMQQPMMGEPVMQQPVMGRPAMQPPMMGQPQPVYSPLSAQPKKKKNVKLIVGLVSALVVAIVAIVVAIVLIVINNTTDVDLKKYVSIEFDGYDTMGTAYVSIDTNALTKDILKEQGENKVSSSLGLLLNGIQLEVSETDNLSNGDVINVKISYSKKQMEDNKLNFKNTELTFTVEGLVALTEIDPFADITVEFEGTSPNGYADYDNESSISCVSNAYFSFDKDYGLNNGDVVTLTVDDYYVQDAIENGYRFTATSKEYTVEGLGFYYQSLDDISKEHMDDFKSLAEEEITDEYFWKDYYATISDLNYVGTYFYKSKDADNYSGNYIILMYTTTVTSTRDEFQPTEIYVPVRITSLQVNAEGGLPYAYATTLGIINVEGQYYSLIGYVDAYSFYVEYMEEYEEFFEIEATEGMPDISQPPVTENPTSPEGESSSEVPTDGGSETPAEGTAAGETETTTAAEAA